MTVDDMKEATADLVDKFFPKGECKERGQAIVLYAQMLFQFHDAQQKEIEEAKMVSQITLDTMVLKHKKESQGILDVYEKYKEFSNLENNELMTPYEITLWQAIKNFVEGRGE